MSYLISGVGTMPFVRKDLWRYVHPYQSQCRNRYQWGFQRSKPYYDDPRPPVMASPPPTKYSVALRSLNTGNGKLNFIRFLIRSKISSNGFLCSYASGSLFSSYSTISKKSKSDSRCSFDEVRFHDVKSQLPPRFSSEELCYVLSVQEDPVLCLELFNWASKQPRFKHDVSTYHIMIKKLGAAKFYQEMDDVVNQVIAVKCVGSEDLFNTMIYYITEARKLTRAVTIFKYMKNSKNLDCRPSIGTYNLLFAAFLSRGRNSYINHMYMETIRCLFKQMVNDGIEPDIFTLNCMIKGYVLSLHVNDALRIFHQMGVVYKCQPNSFSYDYLIHGLCAQSRTNNARELCSEMKKKGFVPSSKSYNSLVNALALDGEVDEAVCYLWEMIAKERLADLITYRTVLDEMCRRGRVKEALRLLKDLQEKHIVDGHTYRKLLPLLKDNSKNSIERNQLSFQDVRGKEGSSWKGRGSNGSR